jgi:two-component system sensor histidine kinase BaeS
MFRTLRRRLILSHVLPLLVIMPVIGIALVYVLETTIVLPGLSRELTAEGISLGELAAQQAGIWTDPRAAQAFADQLSPSRTARVGLVGANRLLLATTAAGDLSRVGQPVTDPELPRALAGEVVVQNDYGRQLRSQRVDVFVPVKSASQTTLGVVRLTYPLDAIQVRFRELRLIIFGVLAVALLLGSGLGLLLAGQLERPLKQITQAVDGLAGGGELALLVEQGPDEVSVLVRAVNALTARLHELEESRRRLLANLVHELGRPLGALYSAVQALQGGAAEDTALRDELLLGMELELKALRGLTDELTHLHAQVLGPLELKRRPTALGEWLPPLIAPWREAALRDGLGWNVALAPGLPTLNVDPERLGQAIGNLLSNALKYTPRGGTLTVGAAAEEHGARIWVGDTGPGIPPDEQGRVFDPFYRGQNARRFPQGLGLGLSIARDVVVAHAGRLELESTPGQGSRFSIWLPASRP